AVGVVPGRGDGGPDGPARAERRGGPAPRRALRPPGCGRGRVPRAIPRPGAPGRAGRAGPASRVYLPERSGNGALHGGPVTAADAAGAVPAGAAARGRGLRAFFGIPSPWVGLTPTGGASEGPSLAPRVGVNVGHVFRTR